MTATETETDRSYNLLFGVRRSVRYHHRRAGFFNVIHKTAMFVSLFAAMTGGVAAIQGHGFWALGLGVIIALFAALDIAADSSRNLALHTLLAYRCQELEKRIACKSELSGSEYEQANTERLSIEQNEPAPLHLLDVLCHYELLRSQGHHKGRALSIPAWRRLSAYLFSQTEYAQKIEYVQEIAN